MAEAGGHPKSGFPRYITIGSSPTRADDRQHPPERTKSDPAPSIHKKKQLPIHGHGKVDVEHSNTGSALPSRLASKYVRSNQHGTTYAYDSTNHIPPSGHSKDVSQESKTASGPYSSRSVSYLSMDEFNKPSEGTITRVQADCGIELTYEQKKSLMDHTNWLRFIELGRQQVAPGSYQSRNQDRDHEYGEFFKDFSAVDRMLIAFTVNDLRRSIEHQEQRRAHAAGDAAVPRPRLTLRKSAASRGAHLSEYQKRAKPKDPNPQASTTRTITTKAKDPVLSQPESSSEPDKAKAVKALEAQHNLSVTKNKDIGSNAKADRLKNDGRADNLTHLEDEDEDDDSFSDNMQDGSSSSASPSKYDVTERNGQTHEWTDEDSANDHQKNKEQTNDDDMQIQEVIHNKVKQSRAQATEDHIYGVRKLLDKQKAVVEPYVGKQVKIPYGSSLFSNILQPLKGSQQELADLVGLDWELVPTGKGKGANKRVDHIRSLLKPILYDRKPNQEIPKYSYYVTLEENVLCESTTKLTYFPYRGDGKYMETDDYEVELNHYYDLNPRIGITEIQRKHEAQQGLPYAELLMGELGITYDVLLEYLLSPDDPCSLLSLPVSREVSCSEDFDRESAMWARVYGLIQGSTVEELQHAAMLCAYWHDIWGWSLWHVLKDSICVERALAHLCRKPAQPSNIREMQCCICLMIDCASHGEVQEYIDDADKEQFLLSRDRAKDKEHRMCEQRPKSKNTFPIIPVDIKTRLPWHTENINGTNHRKYVVSSPRPLGEKIPEKFPRRITTLQWRRTDAAWDPAKRGPFYPCSHEGLCIPSKCSCAYLKIPCEKACACPDACHRRIEGCNCAQKGRPCSTSQCTCYVLNRECDPDICGQCGAREALVKKDEIDTDKCSNIMIRRNIPRKTILGASKIHGLGLFMGEDIRAGEYIGEYKGEVITKTESDRRSLIYDQRNTTYVFDLNMKQDIDAMHKGNKMRFLNHSNNPKVKNVSPKVMLVNMVDRIGMYASRDIKAGEELFFDYRWGLDKKQDFKEHEEADESAGMIASNAANAGTGAENTPIGLPGSAFAIKTKSKATSKKRGAAGVKAVTSAVQQKSIIKAFTEGRDFQDVNSADDDEGDDYLGPLEVPIDSDDGSWHSSDDDIDL